MTHPAGKMYSQGKLCSLLFFVLSIFMTALFICLFIYLCIYVFIYLLNARPDGSLLLFGSGVEKRLHEAMDDKSYGM